MARTIRAPGIGGKLLHISEGTPFNDGENVAFTITRHDRKKLRVNCPLAELGDVFTYLGHLAEAAAEAQDREDPPFPAGHDYIAPIPAQAVGFQAGNSPDMTLLIVRLFGFDMAFSVPSNALAEHADDLARIARTLSAGSGRFQ
jgi:hypothetical protein